MESSPIEISDLRLRLRVLPSRTWERQSQETKEIIEQICTLGGDGELLIPDLIAAMRAGVVMFSFQLVPLIAKLKSRELLDALTAQEDGRYGPSAFEKCKLLKAGFNQFEKPLLDELAGSYERDDSPSCEIVSALAESGTKAALETLEVIEYRVASRIPELRSEFAGVDQDGMGEKVMDQIVRAEFWPWREEFLQELRKAIRRIRERPEPPNESPPNTTSEGSSNIRQLLQQRETDKLEFKAALRSDQNGSLDEKLEHRVIQTVAAFANAAGGTLIIGVEDESRRVIGLEKDYTLLKGNGDLFERHLRQLFQSRFGHAVTILNVKVSFCELDGVVICRVDVEPFSEPVFLKSVGREEFYVRNGNANLPLHGLELAKYLKQRFRN
jgi:hypothetical protein